MTQTMRYAPKGFGGERRIPEIVKRVMRNACLRHDGWIEDGVLVVVETDPRLTWPERELVRQLGRKLYGPRSKEDGHD